MMDNEMTSDIILGILNSPRKHASLVWDCFNLAEKHQFNFFDAILNVERQEVQPDPDDVPENIDTLRECLQFWHVAEMRKRFKDLMEERIVRPDLSS